MKKALVFVLALILLVGVLAACGDKTPETTVVFAHEASIRAAANARINKRFIIVWF